MEVSGCFGLLLLLMATISVLTSAAEPPSVTPEDNQHLDRIIEAMIGTGDFRDLASDFLSAVNDQFGVPLSATLFIPDSFDAAAVSAASDDGGSRLAVAYHIVPRRLSFSDLLLMEPLTRLPTLLPGTSIVVTNNSAFNFSLDGIPITSPDLFLSSSIAIHGMASQLDFSLNGGKGGGDTTLVGSLLPRPRKGRGNSASPPTAARFSGWFLLPVAMAVVAVKTLF